MSQQANSATMSDLDQYFMQASLWPAILYTVILMIVGTIGNILVLVVYRRQFQRSVTRMFIYALAILDLGNCLITMPAELAILIHFTTFPSSAWCKISRYLTYTFNGTSSIVLIAIAMDRYFKVCRPMKTLITVQRAKIICVASFSLTAILSIPALIIYGVIKLPILVSDNGVSILAVTGNLPNSSNFPNSLMTSTTRSFSQTAGRVTPSGGYKTENSTVASSDLSGSLVYGHFCLLNSDHMDGTTPLLFYISMFIMYIVMVFLVVFFYGKVARTMFVLTSKHSKMFSFYTHKHNKQSSNSELPEESVGHVQPEGSHSAIKDVSDTENRTKGSSSASGCFMKGNEEEDREHRTSAGQPVKQHNNRSAPELIQQGNTAETGYETGDTSSNSDAQPEVETIKYQENNRNKKTMIRNSYQDSSPLKSCDHELHMQNHSEQDIAYLDHSQEKSLLQNNIGPQKAHSADEINPKSPDKQVKKQKQKSKIPKIKVEKTSTEDYDSDNFTNNLQSQQPNLALYPLSTNSLLRRRIKSADNISHLSRLHMLQVPNGRARGPRFPDITDFDVSKSSLKKTSHRENTAVIGNVTTNCINLDYITDNADLTTDQQKTLTLTKTSSKGKKKLCVLPLRGMTTKAASHTKEHYMASTVLNVMTKSHTTLDDKKAESTYNSDSKLELRQDHIEAQNLTRSTPTDLNSLNPDSVVTLRNRTPDNAKSLSLPVDTTKPGSVQFQIKNRRKEIPSVTDILQEQHRRGSLHPLRTSRMLFVISLVFVISFLPFFVIALARSIIGPSFLTLSELELGVMSVFIRSSLISNAVNPVAYGLLSTHFRRECTGIMCCMFRR